MDVYGKNLVIFHVVLSIIMAMKVIELRTMEILLNSIKLRISDGRGNGPLEGSMNPWAESEEYFTKPNWNNING